MTKLLIAFVKNSQSPIGTPLFYRIGGNTKSDGFTRRSKMKVSMYIALLALTSSISAFAIPPIPPSTVSAEPVVVRCTDFNSLDSEELAALEDNRELIISLDQETREICFKNHN